MMSKRSKKESFCRKDPESWDAQRVSQWIRDLPKAERHIHLEGAFRWDTVREAHPDGARLPLTSPWRADNNPFPKFQDFLDAFRKYLRPASGTFSLVERHTYEVLEDLAGQNVKYAEVTVGPQFHAAQGLSLSKILEAMGRGKESAEEVFDIEVDFLLGLQRHDPPQTTFDHCREALEVAGPGGMNILSGADLQGDERIGEASAHAGSFDLVREAGLRVRAHAGELCGPESVQSVVRKLGITEIAHGIRATESPDLIKELARTGVVCHVCPTSNIRLKVYESYATHPLRTLFDAGCSVTLNSDDPLLFGTTITEEFERAYFEMGFSVEDLTVMAQQAFRTSFLASERKDPFIAEIGK